MPSGLQLPEPGVDIEDAAAGTYVGWGKGDWQFYSWVCSGARALGRSGASGAPVPGLARPASGADDRRKYQASTLESLDECVTARFVVASSTMPI